LAATWTVRWDFKISICWWSSWVCCDHI
jgi:hypothetical protein